MTAPVWQSILDALIVIAHIVSDFILEFFLGRYWGERRQCPALIDETQAKIVTKSGVELAELIRTRKFSAYEVVKAYCDRMRDVNKDLNAVVDGPFPEALQLAKEIDAKLEKGEYSEDELKRLPFLGVPFTTKDSTAVGGKLHTLGLMSRRNERAPEDAECVRLMRAAGAIIIATTNVPEVNKWCETRNMLIGQTKNPYDMRRSVGGSSGGEGAMISACGTAIGLGTDIGGSIRIPAFNCGIFGHKPTVGVVDTRGCTFRTGKEKHTMVVAGPMARNVNDLLPMLKVLAGEKMSATLKLDQKVDAAKLRYFYAPDINMKQCNPVNSEAQRTMRKVCDHLASVAGKDVKIANLPELNLASRMWRYWMTQEPADFNKLLGNGVALNPFVELFKKAIGQSEFTMASIYSLIDALLPKEREQMIRAATIKCKQALNELLGNDGVLLFHSSPRTTPFHYYPLFKYLDFSYFCIFNVLQVPVTQVPLGLDSKGLPLGIQVVATEMNDRLCLEVASQLAGKFGGWVPPFSSR